jgi:NADH-quinone oxidoreductase subunit C
MSQPTEVAEESAPEPVTLPVTLHGCPLLISFGQQVLHVPRQRYIEVTRALLADGYEMCVDLTVVDYLLMPGRAVPDDVVAERFEVVVNLLSRAHKRRIRIRVQVPDADPNVPSLFDMWAGAEAFEREVFDLMGIVFTDHPDLTRILMPEDWEGHPLRKDYAVGRVPVQFKAAPSTR